MNKAIELKSVVDATRRSLRLFAFLALTWVASLRAQDHTVTFSTTDPGVTRAVTNWGMGTIGGYDVMQSGIINMGADEIDVVIMPFALEGVFVNGTFTGLTTGAKQLIADGLATARVAKPTQPVILSAGNGPAADYITGANRVNTSRWAETMLASKQYAETNSPGQPVVWMSPFNEPDYGPWNMGNGADLFNIIQTLQANPAFSPTKLGGAANLNVDTAVGWYDTIKSLHPIGTTHAIGGSVAGFVNFLNDVTANGDVSFCPELHCMGEAIIGAEYGMGSGIYWLRVDRARGSFAKACQGKRLGYADDWAKWTAAAVYRGTNGAVQGFLGGNERMGAATSYRFFSKDRDVFYNGDGPRRDFTLNTGPTKEQVMGITWGADAPPPIAGRYVLVSRNSGKVMEVVGSSTNDGANIQQNSYTNGLNQQWDIAPYYPGGGDQSYYTMTAAHSGKAADLAGFSYGDGGNVQQWTNYPGMNQLWILEYVTNGWFNIRNGWSGKYLDVFGVSTANGANIDQWTGNGGLNQQWRLVPVGALLPTNITTLPVLTGVSATANPLSVKLNWNASVASDLAGYTVLRSTTNGGPYEIVARGLVNNSFTDKFANQKKTYYYVVKAADKSLNTSANSAQVSATPTGNPAVVAKYAFDGNFSDSSINANHPIVTNGTPQIVGGKYSPGISLNGTDQSFMLPANMFASVTNFTIAAWVYWGGGAQWQRIFDFGNDATQYMFLTPNSGGGTLRFAITSGAGEQIVETAVMPSNQWRHVAITLTNNTCRLYTNGVLAATVTITNFPAVFNPALNYLGKSQFADPLFNGRLDEFVVYNYALGATEVANLSASPLPTGPALIAKYQMEGNANDTSGNGLHGAAIGSPAYVAGQFATAMSLDGVVNYVALPGSLMTGVSNFTFAAWVYWNGGSAWQRIFDFGNNTTQYMFLSPSSGSGTLRFTVTTNGGGGEQTLETSALPVGQWRHVAITRNGNIARLYTNGVVVIARTNIVTVAPANFNPALNYLGKSQYADPLFNGRLDEVFLYNYALTDAEITRLANNLPPPPTVSTSLSTLLAGNTLLISWPTNYLGCRLESNSASLTATGNWFTVSGSASTNQMAISINPSGSNVFFRLVYP